MVLSVEGGRRRLSPVPKIEIAIRQFDSEVVVHLVGETRMQEPRRESELAVFLAAELEMPAVKKAVE